MTLPILNDGEEFTAGQYNEIRQRLGNDATLPMLLPVFTTTERDALTPMDGSLIYNSTTNKAQIRAAGAWVDLH